MNKTRSKNSIYVDSLVNFALDTKPYHSKLTEIAVEYRFDEAINVKIEDTVASRMLAKASWLYNYFSGGNSAFRSLQLKPLENPHLVRTQKNDDAQNNAGAFKVGRDENTDMLGVPFVYDRKHTIGFADVWKQGTRRENLLRGHDYFHVYGSAQIRTSFAPYNSGDQTRRWQLTNDEGVMNAVTAATQAIALDVSNQNSPISRIRSILDSINTRLTSFPNQTAQAELNALRGITGIATDVSSVTRAANVVTVKWAADDTALLAAYTVGRQVTVNASGTAFDGTFTIASSGIVDGQFQITYSHVGGNETAVSATIALTQPTLPRSYEALFNALVAAGTPPISGYTGWKGEDGFAPDGTTPQAGATYVDDTISRLTPPAFFNVFSDASLRESSTLVYPQQVEGTGFTISEISGQVSSEEWTIEVVEASPLLVSVSGSSSGLIGIATPQQRFTSSTISFTLQSGATSAVQGERVIFSPTNRFSASSTSSTQVWNLIKTDPIAYSRPSFVSTRYGSIQDLNGVVGKVSILDQTLPTGTIVLTATSSTQFQLSSTADSAYAATITVGSTFNDGRLGFKLTQGTAQSFAVGDRFFIRIINPEPKISVDMFYGYDLDSYDNMTAVYNNTDPLSTNFNRLIEFRYNSRFSDFDLSSLNIIATDSVVSNRKFRLTAKPNGSPVSVLQKNGSGPSNQLDLAGPGGGTDAPVVSMPGDSNIDADLLVFYADSFKLEYSDNDFETSVFVADVPVNGTFTDSALGISLSLPEGSKPFIAVSSDDGLGNARVEGGDIFIFSVVNNAPFLDDVTILSSANIPYLLMHGESFWRAPDAEWTVAFTSSSAFNVSAVYTAGLQIGQVVQGYPKNGSLDVTGTGVFQNATFKDDLVHFTIKAGSMGFVAGDQFRFKTFADKPSILVHGSVSGWQQDAEIGKWYSNGEVAFKINLPKTNTFVEQEGSLIETTIAGFVVDWIRPDAPSCEYTFKKISGGRFIVYRSGTGVTGSVASVGTFQDDFISIQLNNPVFAEGEWFKLEIKADDLVFWSGIDAVIVRTDIDVLAPQAGEFINIQKAQSSRLGIAINYQEVGSPPSLSTLSPIGINDDFISIDTGSINYPIEKYSPEVTIFDGWIPLIVEGRDATNSIAFFPDSTSEHRIFSAASGQAIGRVFSSGSINDPVMLEWDQQFHETFLPLNAEANIVTYDNGIDEKVKVNFFERITFLISGGVLLEDALFSDEVVVNVGEENSLNIITSQVDQLNVLAEDGPFTRFLPGYANLPFDLEIGSTVDGQYDTGVPLVDHFMRAQFLSAKSILSTPEQQELNSLLGLIDPLLQPGGLTATSLPDFLAKLDTDEFVDTPVNAELGIPSLGLAVDTNKNDIDTSSATIIDALTISFTDQPSALDVLAFDAGGLDAMAEFTTSFMIPTLPPVPTVVPADATFESIETPLITAAASRTFILNFLQPVFDTPAVRIATQDAPALLQVPVVERLSDRSFSFSIPNPAVVKVVLS